MGATSGGTVEPDDVHAPRVDAPKPMERSVKIVRFKMDVPFCGLRRW
jgi:hypothetical protein